MKPALKVPGTVLLKLRCGKSLSRFAFNFNLHRYSLVVMSATLGQVGAAVSALLADADAAPAPLLVGGAARCPPLHPTHIDPPFLE